MSLLVNVWKTAYSKTTPLSNVLAWIASLTCDFASMSGRVNVNVNMSVEAAQDGSAPIDQWGVALGQSFTFEEDGETKTVTFPTLAEILSDNQEHFDAIRDYLYDKLKYMPPFRGSTQV
jgi:hypothetical protein